MFSFSIDIIQNFSSLDFISSDETYNVAFKQPLNEYVPILVTESGILMLSKFEQLEKVYCLISFKLAKISTSTNWSQYSNAFCPISVTDSGIVIFVNPANWKDQAPILLNLLFNSIEDKDQQFLNAYKLIDSNDSGNLT